MLNRKGEKEMISDEVRMRGSNKDIMTGRGVDVHFFMVFCLLVRREEGILTFNRQVNTVR